MDDRKEFYNLTALLRHVDMCTRQLAEERPDMTVGRYYDLIGAFHRDMPDLIAALDAFAERTADRESIRTIENTITILSDIECDKYVLGLHSLLDAYGRKGNWRAAALHAKSLSGVFADFNSLITTAIAKDADQKVLGLSLREYIRQLDEEEDNRKLVILAVDDSPSILKSVSSVLSDLYKVYTLPKPMELERVLRTVTPELFLLDYQMPERDGFDLIPIIRSFEAHVDTPIVFLTSAGNIDNVTSAIALGACDYIVKPFKSDVLRDKIARHIERKRTF